MPYLLIPLPFARARVLQILRERRSLNQNSGSSLNVYLPHTHTHVGCFVARVTDVLKKKNPIIASTCFLR